MTINELNFHMPKEKRSNLLERWFNQRLSIKVLIISLIISSFLLGCFVRSVLK